MDDTPVRAGRAVGLVVLVVLWPVAGVAGGAAVTARDGTGTPSDAVSRGTGGLAGTPLGGGSVDAPVARPSGPGPSTGLVESNAGVVGTSSSAGVADGGSATRKPYFEYSANGTTVTFDGTPIVTRQIEDDFPGSPVNVTYEWEFGDGSTATGAKPTHAYDSGGFYDVSVEVFATWETAGQSSSVSGNKKIAVGQEASFTVTPERPTLNETVVFDATGTPVPGNATNVTYRWGGLNLSGPTPTWDPGGVLASPLVDRGDFPLSFPVRLSITATTGSGSTTYVKRGSVTVYPGEAAGSAPTARFAVVPERGTAGIPMRFEANVSDPGSGTAYEWSFGDGTTATGREVRHAFDAAGNYTVELTVTDDAGRTDAATKTVRVSPSPVDQYDTDDDGLELEEMHTALEDFESANAAGATNGTAGNVSLEDTRQLLEEFAHDASDIDPPEFDPNGTDTDGDGLPDELELDGVPVLKTAVTDDTDLVASSTGDGDRIVRVNTDRKQSDTDGDGLSDAVELGQKRNLTTGTEDTTIETDTVYYAFNSDPTDGKSADTDDDGLPDKLEKRGIPVRETYNLTDHQSDAFDNADVNGTTDVGRKKLQTDPSDPDTDGDGLRDGEEVGKRIDGPVGFYYTLVSDPTDVNTDDAGVDDAEEIKKGSDPTIPESFSVSAIFPVLGKSACDPTDEADNTVNNCAKPVANDDGSNVYALKAIKEYNHEKLDPTKPPKWLSEVDDSKIRDDQTYYLIRVEITSEADVLDTGNLPIAVNSIGFTLADVVGIGPSKDSVDDTRTANTQVFTSGESGSTTVYVAVRSRSTRSDDVPAKYVLFGKASITISIPDGPYARGRFSGHETRTIRSNSAFVVEDALPRTSPDAARAMVQEATQKFAQGVASAVVPVNAGALSATSFKVLSRGGLAAGTMVANEGVAMFTSIGKAPAVYVDDLVGKAIAGEGTVPAYLRGRDDAEPTANVAMTLYRAN